MGSGCSGRLRIQHLGEIGFDLFQNTRPDSQPGIKWQGIGDKQLSRWSCAAPLLTFHLKGHFSLNIIFSVDNLNKVRFILLNFPGFPGDTFVRRDITS